MPRRARSLLAAFHSRNTFGLAAGALLLLSAALPLGGCLSGTYSSMDFSAERSASVDAAGASRVEVSAGAGSLRIESVDGLGEVRASGTARASEEAVLQDVQIFTERRGDAVRLEARFPQDTNARTALDLVIEIPPGMDLDATDSSGDAEVSGIASLRFDDSSGDLRVRDVSGEARIQDSSGDVRAEGVGGAVRVNDSSGDVRLRDIGGAITLTDSSGDLDVVGAEQGVTVTTDSSGDMRFEEAAGAVLVRSDSSGDIEARSIAGGVRVESDSSGDVAVRGVGGDFVVVSKSSGDIRHEDVSGRVELPREWSR